MFDRKTEPSKTSKTNQSSNQIGLGTHIVGDIKTHQNIRIEGEITGNIVAKEKLVIGQDAAIKGNLLAKNAEIYGTVDGLIEISELLIIRDSAKIKGDIKTGKLTIEPGGIFDGKCKMGNSQQTIALDSTK